MTTRRALALAAGVFTAHQWSTEILPALLAAGFCPDCAQDGKRSKLGRWEPPTHETYGGRECPSCEMFWPDERAGGVETEPDYGGAWDGLGSVASDADPGL